MLCKRKEEFEGKQMGFLSIIYYSILLFHLTFFFSDQDQFFSFSLFFFFANATRVGQFCREEFSLVATLLRPP